MKNHQVLNLKSPSKKNWQWIYSRVWQKGPPLGLVGLNKVLYLFLKISLCSKIVLGVLRYNGSFLLYYTFLTVVILIHKTDHSSKLGSPTIDDLENHKIVMIYKSSNAIILKIIINLPQDLFKLGNKNQRRKILAKKNIKFIFFGSIFFTTAKSFQKS